MLHFKFSNPRTFTYIIVVIRECSFQFIFSSFRLWTIVLLSHITIYINLVQFSSVYYCFMPKRTGPKYTSIIKPMISLWRNCYLITDLGGNAATNYMLIFALLASTTGVASVVAGFTHFRAWSVASMAAAASSAAISWAISGLAFGLAWKEVKLGGRRGKRLQTLEIFLIISTLIHLLYIMLLHAGSFNQKYGLSYGGPTSEGPTSEAQKTTGSEPHVAAWFSKLKYSCYSFLGLTCILICMIFKVGNIFLTVQIWWKCK